MIDTPILPETAAAPKVPAAHPTGTLGRPLAEVTRTDYRRYLARFDAYAAPRPGEARADVVRGFLEALAPTARHNPRAAYPPPLPPPAVLDPHAYPPRRAPGRRYREWGGFRDVPGVEWPARAARWSATTRHHYALVYRLIRRVPGDGPGGAPGRADRPLPRGAAPDHAAIVSERAQGAVAPAPRRGLGRDTLRAHAAQ